MVMRRATRRAALAAGGELLASAFLRPTRSRARQGNALTGRVIWPGDAEYEAARLDFNAHVSRYPAAIVVCSKVRDVQNAIRYARQQGLPIRARSGGHSYEAYSVVDGGLVVDLGGMAEVTVDPSTRTATVGAGVKLEDLYNRLAQQGVTIPGGTCPGVGIAGLALGGGIGFLSRQHGLTCDSLLAVDLVDGNGRRLRASADENADLFWALRGGGGGNFGIATAFTFRTIPAGNVLLCAISWPWEDASVVLDAWQRWAPFVDHRLTCGFAIGPPSDGVISATALFTGSAGELTPLLAPLLRAGSPGPPRIWSTPFLEATRYLGGAGGAHAWFKNTSGFATELLPPAAITTLVDWLRAAPADQVLVGFFPLQGAVAAVDPAATAYVHRRALFDLQYQAYWWDEANAEAGIAWARGIRDAMLPYTSGSYVNYIDADLPNWARDYYGSNLARLSRVKAAYDPDNLFAAPQAIPAVLGGS